MQTKWQGLWTQERSSFYAGRVINKKDIPPYTRIVVRHNKYWEKGKNRPRFVYCFANSEEYSEMCQEVEEYKRPYCENETYYDEKGNRLYTHEEVRRIISGAIADGAQGYEAGDILIEDYI